MLGKASKMLDSLHWRKLRADHYFLIIWSRVWQSVLVGSYRPDPAHARVPSQGPFCVRVPSFFMVASCEWHCCGPKPVPGTSSPHQTLDAISQMKT
jgi:hypothetical protein